MSLSLSPVQRSKSLYEQTYATLRASILSGELAPGDRLVETQLAERLGVSRTPIREALRQLQRETLISTDGSGGLRVTVITPVDAAQLYDCRMALEALSVRQACDHVTASKLEAIAALITEAEAVLMRSQHPPDRLPTNPSPQRLDPQLLDLDYRFHRTIAESSGNPWLVSLLDQVFDKMALLRIQTTRHNPNVLEVRDEHWQIYQAIAQRQPEAAVAAIQAHLAASKTRVIQTVKTLQVLQ